MKLIAILLSLLLFVTATATDSKDQWFSGTVEAAIEQARTEKKPMLIFWTAVWCPYCNEIKSAVFTKPQFLSLMKDVIPVMIDGDSSQAQFYAEKYNLVGFPTVLFLNSNGEEIARIAENLTMEEFESTFHSVTSSQATAENIIKSIRAETLNPTKTAEAYGALSRFSWSGDKWPSKVLTPILYYLASTCPIDLPAERGALASQLLSAVSSLTPEEINKNTELKAINTRVKDDWKNLLNRVIKSPRSIFAARGFLLSSADDFIPWLSSFSDQQTISYAITKINRALKQLRKNPNTPVYTRLESYYTEISFAQKAWKKDPNAPISSGLKKNVLNAVKTGMSEAKSSLVRQSSVSIAAHLLQEVGETSQAISLLETEAKNSETPYIYYSHLASIYEKKGAWDDALKWSDDATKAATGSMTKARWIAKDIALQSRMRAHLEPSKWNTMLSGRANEYFEFTLSQPNPFAASSTKRHKSVIENLKIWSEKSENKSQIKLLIKKCDGQADKYKAPCLKMFEPWLSAAPSANEAAAEISAIVNTVSKSAQLTLKTPPSTKLNLDGPWKWELLGPIVDKGGAPSKLDKSALNAEKGLLTASFSNPISNAEIRSSRWNLVYFLCNAANTWCKRIATSGTFAPAP